MLRRSVSTCAIATVLLAACSSGGGGAKNGNLTLAQVQNATAKEKTAAITGTRGVGKASGPIAGKYRADPAMGTYTAPVFVPGAQPQQAEVRIVDGQTYVARSIVPAAARESEQLLTPDFVGMRLSGEKQWLQVPPVLAGPVGTPLLQGPFVLLDTLAQTSATMTKSTRDEVDGASVTRYDVTGVSVLAQYRLSGLTLWVDGNDRLRRVRVAGASTIDYTVAGFGTSVDVQVPPADQTTKQLPASGPPAPLPTGAFTTAASGNAAGLSWTLSKAWGSRGATCWKLETTPAVAMTVNDAVQCQVPVDAKKVGDAQSAQFPFQSNASGAYDIVVGTIPNVKNATFKFTDNKTAKPSYIDPKTGVVVWAGKSRPFLGAATVTLTDGNTLGCGPGEIVSIDQLYGKDDTQLLDERKYPWGCLEN